MDEQDGRSVDLMIMSGVDDGTLLSFSMENGDGEVDLSGSNPAWVIRLGRRDDNDVCLRNDTFSSRYHAKLLLRSSGWYLEDCDSKNGTFVEDTDEDCQVTGAIPIQPGQLFRVGRTWLRIQPTDIH